MSGPAGEVIAEYRYDHTGKRIKKNEGGVVTYYWFDNFEQIVYPNGTVVNVTYYSANNERLAKKVSTAAGDKMYYFHPDHLGSTSIISDEDGNLVEKTEYYPYGSVKQGGGEQYLFTGKELDRGTGLYYYGARYYNPELMRFTQPDIFIQDPYDPQSLNRYAYVRNNPLKYVDPSGNVFVLIQGPITYETYYTNGKKGAYGDIIPDPEPQLPSRQEYYNQKRSEIPWGLVIAVADSTGIVDVDKTVSGYAIETGANKLGREAKNLNALYGVSQFALDDMVAYYEAASIVSKSANDDGLEAFLKEYEHLPFAIPSYPTYLRMSNYNPHTSTGFIPYSSRGGGTSPSGSTGSYGHESQNTGARYDYDRGKIVRLN